MHTFMVPCLLGLEKLVGDEIRRLGLKDVQVENGRVLFSGEARDMAKANICLRTGERVLIVLADFPAKTFEELFQGVYHANLEDFIPKDGSFPVKGHCLNSQLMSVPDCQAIVKKAASRRLGEKYGVSWLPETGAKYQLQFSIMNDRVQLYLDTSGEGLYKRGYRARNMGAPLRETLAAALVTLSRYRGKDPFCDPFCGSGTIPIEAALIAKNRAPGLDRSFAAQKWKNMDSKLWLEAGDEAMDKEFHGHYDIWGGDIDPAAVELARHNAELAGVEDCIRFEVADAGKFHRDSEYGQLVTNPPYGERMLETEEARELYRIMGERLLPLDGSQLYVITPDEEFEDIFGQKADKNRKIYNGMLKTYFYQFMGPRPPKRSQENRNVD